jgi:hypothetical protein
LTRFGGYRRTNHWRPRYHLMDYGVSSCDDRCWNATSPPSACRCSCRGAYHGAGYRRHYPRYQDRTIVFQPLSTPSQHHEVSVNDYFRSVGKAALTSAVVYGLSAASPPLGTVLIPAYTAYNYSSLGYGLLKAYREGKASPSSIQVVSRSIGEVAAQDSADVVASAIINNASRSGLFKEIATRTGIKEVVISEMMRASTSSALSTGGGELAKFAITKAVGA